MSSAPRGSRPDDLDRIDAAARHAPIVRSGNMSLGVNLLAALTRRAAAALGDEFDIEIVEMHHRMKVDAPSGTALMLGEAAAEGRGIALKDPFRARPRRHHRRAAQGRHRFRLLRGGTVVGDHSVIFAGEGERLVLSHQAEDRTLFACGALKAAALGARPQARPLFDGRRAGAQGGVRRAGERRAGGRLSAHRARRRTDDSPQFEARTSVQEKSSLDLFLASCRRGP